MLSPLSPCSPPIPYPSPHLLIFPCPLSPSPPSPLPHSQQQRRRPGHAPVLPCQLVQLAPAGAYGNARTTHSRSPPLNGGELHLRNQGTHLCRLASSSNSHQLARLLEFGADPNAADYDGRTALHVAAAEGHLNVVKVSE
ncbi:unnamed protein product [Closterium sp. Yama58-4]|nr:unnamed protein product [Closterium sp. Yama58-4]